MRIFFLFAALLGVSPSAFATSSQQLLAVSNLSSADPRAFSLESIRLIQIPASPSQTKVETCDVGDNAQICVNNGKMKSVVEVRVAYTNANGEAESVALWLTLSSFSHSQLREIANGAAPDSLVNLAINTTKRMVSTSEQSNCSQSDAFENGCKGAIVRKQSVVNYVTVAVSARR
ncbi:MAG: hypothetical protein ACXWQO_16595 [Bdellovibrionota bacterium]